MEINKEFLGKLFEQAVENPRLRQSYDLRTSSDDNSQRILNALLPGTIVPIHRHPNSNENVLLLCGKLVEIIYDEKLYTFSTSELVKWIKKIPTQNKIILFGHNPCFTHFINTFTDDYLDNLWTSGVAIMQFEQVEWSKLRKGKLKHLVNPKEILI